MGLLGSLGISRLYLFFMLISCLLFHRVSAYAHSFGEFRLFEAALRHYFLTAIRVAAAMAYNMAILAYDFVVAYKTNNKYQLTF